MKRPTGTATPAGRFVFKENIMDDKTIEKYLQEQKQLDDIILSQLKVGGSEEYNNSISLFPIGTIPSPVRIPCWMFRKFPKHKFLELDDLEKVALAHVIHFTNADNPYGYIECSGDIESYCRCTVEEAHNALNRLLKKNLIEMRTVPTEICKGHKRNFAYYVNVSYLHSILMLYGTDIWI